MKIKVKLFFLYLMCFLMVSNLSRASEWLDCTALLEDNSYDNREALKYLVPGKEGWVFISKKDFKQNFELNKESLSALKKFQTTLKTFGTDLVLVIPPPRGLIHSDQINFSHPLAKDYNNEEARQSLQNMVTQLQENGFIIAESDKILAANDYGYQRDHHWNSNGAKLTANETAKQIKRLSTYNELNKKDFILETGNQIQFKGSFYNPVKDICKIKLPVQNIQQQTSVLKDKKFYDDSSPKITLVGTSYSEEGKSKANFADHLRVTLSAEINNQALGGGGISHSIKTYLDSDKFKQNPAKILIWEIPGFYSLNRPKLYQELIEILEQND